MKRKRFTPEHIIRIIKESELGTKNVDISLKYGGADVLQLEEQEV